MKEPYVKPELVLSPASQEALRAFLAQARAALLLARDVVPTDDCACPFAFGGLPEVEQPSRRLRCFSPPRAIVMRSVRPQS